MKQRFRPFWAIVLLAAMLVLPGSAHADDIGAGYSDAQLTWDRGDGPEAFSCYSWSGGSDGEGTSYLACDRYIYRVGPDGTYLGAIRLEDGYRARRDVAPTWNGNAIYYTVSPAPEDGGIGTDDFDPAIRGTNVGKVVRLVRNDAGAWVRDTSFNVGPFYPGGPGTRPWAARNVAVDRAGHVYVTVNEYVMVFGPSGRHIATFGGGDNKLEIAEGLAVTPDGRHVYVAEQKLNLVERWDKAADGTWHRASWQIGHDGLQVETVGGRCGANDYGPPTTDYLASPYDVGLDGAGNVYVLDTSCQRILKYTPGGIYTTTIWYQLSDMGGLYHGFIVNWHGDVLVPEQGIRYVRDASATAQNILCAPDSDAPRFTNVNVPGTIHARSVFIDVRGSDRCSAVTGIRIGSGPWQPYQNHVQVTVTDGDGPKTITISIRDAWGRTRTITRTLTFLSAPLIPRRSVSIRGLSRSCEPNPQGRLAAGWRVADRCATFTGRVVSTRSRGAQRQVLLEVGYTTAQALYRDAAGPVRIWVVIDRATTGAQRVPSGSFIRVTSAFATSQDGSMIVAAPTWRVSLG